MSAPETKAAVPSAAKPRPAGPPSRARALNLISIGAIATAIGLVAVAAVPAWIKTGPTVVSVNDMPTMPNFRPDGLPPLPQHPSFVTDDDDDRGELVDPTDPRSRTGAGANPRGRPLDRSLPPDLPPGLPGGPETMIPMGPEQRAPVVRLDKGAQPRFGTARRAVALLAEPGDVSHILGQVKANERVMIVKEQGEWAFVIHGGQSPADEMGTGWIKKNEIAIR